VHELDGGSGDPSPSLAPLITMAITPFCVRGLPTKTPDRMAAWIALPDAFAVVAESDCGVIGFALMSLRGEVRLCYVAPEAQQCGIGRATMAALEQEAASRNLTAMTVESTQTAHSFYVALGFVDSGAPLTLLSVTAQPMRKPLPNHVAPTQ
jgi:GNAT superfamily N-acetyltransferase